jgi:hypothetical protein
MTTNIDRAAEHLDSLDRLYDYASGQEPTNAERAQALADNGYLMPDLPEPTRWKQNEEPEWDACETTVSPAGYEGRVIVEDAEDRWEASAEDIRALALALLAAADYAERNQE